MENVLIIDDEKSLLDLLSVVFKKEGYGVRTALSAAQGFDVLDKEDIDLVVTDIKMPGTDGMEVLKLVRDDHPEVPVVMISGDTETCSQAKSILGTDIVTAVVKEATGRQAARLLPAEGIQPMKTLGQNMAWLLKKLYG
jgi:DNA-binding NtrC family response regulator